MKEKRIIINTAIILIVIIIIAFIVSKFGLIETRIPTGNIDIIDITFSDKDNNCECNCKCNGERGCSCDDSCICKYKERTKTAKKKKSSKSNNDSINNTTDNGTNADINNATNDEIINDNNGTNGEDDENTDDEYETGNVEVFDNEVRYAQNTELNIFTHRSYYTKNDVIAPGTENSYQFIVRNNNTFGIKYDLNFTEENDYNVNMKYRLKMNGNYVGDSINRWLAADELEHLQIVLSEKSYNTYTLDWKWFDSSNDIQIGKNVESSYKLSVEVGVSQYIK